MPDYVSSIDWKQAAERLTLDLREAHEQLSRGEYLRAHTTLDEAAKSIRMGADDRDPVTGAQQRQLELNSAYRDRALMLRASAEAAAGPVYDGRYQSGVTFVELALSKYAVDVPAEASGQ